MQTRLENQTDGFTALTESIGPGGEERDRASYYVQRRMKSLLNGNFELGRKSGNYRVGKTVTSNLY